VKALMEVSRDKMVLAHAMYLS